MAASWSLVSHTPWHLLRTILNKSLISGVEIPTCPVPMDVWTDTTHYLTHPPVAPHVPRIAPLTTPYQWDAVLITNKRQFSAVYQAS
jgi:hypothetical protein